MAFLAPYRDARSFASEGDSDRTLAQEYGLSRGARGGILPIGIGRPPRVVCAEAQVQGFLFAESDFRQRIAVEPVTKRPASSKRLGKDSVIGVHELMADPEAVRIAYHA